MINKIGLFFKNLNQGSTDNSAEKISLELACAVLLCAVMRADHHFSPDEQAALDQLLTDKFHLTVDEVAEVVNLALTHSNESNDLYTYTSIINNNFNIEDKKSLVNMLWQVANADGDIAAIESHIIRKIADLLHLRHSEYIATKLPR